MGVSPRVEGKRGRACRVPKYVVEDSRLVARPPVGKHNNFCVEQQIHDMRCWKQTKTSVQAEWTTPHTLSDRNRSSEGMRRAYGKDVTEWVGVNLFPAPPLRSEMGLVHYEAHLELQAAA